MAHEVAETIAAQVGHMAFCMLGAKNILGDETGLQFKIQGSPKKVTNIVIKLEPTDTYRIEFWNIRGVKMKTLETVEGAYAADLRRIIADATGLYVKL